MVEICKSNEVFMFNGRLGEDCGIYKPNTTYHTTVDCFLGSQSIMQLLEILKVLELKNGTLRKSVRMLVKSM